MLIALSDVRAAIASALGERLAQTPNLCEHAAGILRGWVPQQTDPNAVEAEREDALFSDLYAALGPSMLMQDARGHWARLKTEALSDVADRLLGVVFRALPKGGSTCAFLRDYAMREGSVSAMETLLALYAEELAPAEADVLRRVVRESGRNSGEAE